VPATPPRLITYADLQEATGRPAATLRVWVLRGKMPAPDYRVGRSPAWLPETIQPWLDLHYPSRKDPQ
jgi:hypothetical protein